MLFMHACLTRKVTVDLKSRVIECSHVNRCFGTVTTFFLDDKRTKAVHGR